MPRVLFGSQFCFFRVRILHSHGSQDSTGFVTEDLTFLHGITRSPWDQSASTYA